MSAARPSVSLIVPFAGTAGELRRVVEVLARVRVRQGDEVIVADNSARPSAIAPGRVHVVDATGTRTPGFARNHAARIAHGEWLVFIDADTEPSAFLLDDYFDPAPDTGVGVLAGAIRDVASRPTLAARYSVARRQLSERMTLKRAGRPYAQTANCAVRRRAFEQVGGFDEHARAGEDADLCFRLARAGWALEPRPRAGVRHRSRTTIAALLAQLSRHGSGAAWCERRHPGSFPAQAPLSLARRLAGHARDALAAASRRDREATAFALLDIAAACAFESGRLRANGAGRGFGRTLLREHSPERMTR